MRLVIPMLLLLASIGITSCGDDKPIVDQLTDTAKNWYEASAKQFTVVNDGLEGWLKGAEESVKKGGKDIGDGAKEWLDKGEELWNYTAKTMKEKYPEVKEDVTQKIGTEYPEDVREGWNKMVDVYDRHVKLKERYENLKKKVSGE